MTVLHLSAPQVPHFEKKGAELSDHKGPFSMNQEPQESSGLFSEPDLSGQLYHRTWSLCLGPNMRPLPITLSVWGLLEKDNTSLKGRLQNKWSCYFICVIPPSGKKVTGTALWSMQLIVTSVPQDGVLLQTGRSRPTTVLCACRVCEQHLGTRWCTPTLSLSPCPPHNETVNRICEFRLVSFHLLSGKWLF